MKYLTFSTFFFTYKHGSVKHYSQNHNMSGAHPWQVNPDTGRPECLTTHLRVTASPLTNMLGTSSVVYNNDIVHNTEDSLCVYKSRT